MSAPETPSQPAPESVIGQLLGGRYRLQAHIGSGGLGDVYRAWDIKLDRAVALKRVRVQGEGAQSERALLEQTWREVMTTVSLRHPNIVTILDYGIGAEGAYVVMELVEGETLEEVLARGPLQFFDFHRFAQQSLQAIVAAHAAGLIHRDLKPGNFMITRPVTSNLFNVKILDFGLAKYLDTPKPQSMDHLNSLMGSVHYMAPEQFQRMPLDQRTDLYSLGCIFYEAVTGHPAFDGANVSELIEAHLKHEPFSMKYLRQDLSLELERWIDRLLEKDPSHRTASAAAALASLPSLPACSHDKRRSTHRLFAKFKR
jgi:eukaryotic-like serine/threonine-protein kinase